MAKINPTGKGNSPGTPSGKNFIKKPPITKNNQLAQANGVIKKPGAVKRPLIVKNNELAHSNGVIKKPGAIKQRNPLTGHSDGVIKGPGAIGDLSHIQNHDDTGMWPLTKYSFVVDIGGFDGKVAFGSIDGLGSSVSKLEFRDGNSKKFFKQNRPTLTSFDPVTLKKGMMYGDQKLFDWYKNVSTGTLFSDMRTVVIDMCELHGNDLNVVFKWVLEKAYVTKFTPTNLDSMADSEIAIEEVELSYQSFEMVADPGIANSVLSTISALSSIPLVGGIAGAAASAVNGL